MNERFERAPHHSERNSAPSPNAALLIDFDNVTMGIRSNLGQELRQLLNSDIIRGKVSVQRAYADWRRYPQYVVPLSEAAIDLIYAPAYGSSKKNATDIRLAIDALELVFTRPEIGSFILLSGDSDFSSLVLKLKEYGKYVIGVGMQESSSDLLVQNCDEYYSYDSLSGLVTAEEMDTERHDPWELAEASIKKMVERDDVMRSDRLKQVMLELDPSFDEKEIGYSKFNRFLTEASSRGILTLEKIGNGQYRVGPGGSVDVAGSSEDGSGGPDRERRESREKTASSSDSGGPARGGGEREAPEGGGDGAGGAEDSREGGRQPPRRAASGGDRPVVETEQLRAAYRLLQDVVSDLSEAGEGVRDSEVKREMLNRDPSFDEGALGFSKFSRFIRQCHDEGVVDVDKDSDGNYYLSAAGEDRPAAGAERREGAPAGAERERTRQTASPGAGGAEPAGEAAADEAGARTAEGDREAAGEQPTPESGGEEPTADSAAGEATPAASGDEPGDGSAEEDGPSSRRGVGLRRRGRAGEEERSGSGDSWVPGPVDTGRSGDEDGASSGGRAASSGPAGAAASGDSSSGRRGVGRFRRGRKSGGGDDSGGSGEEGPSIGPVDEPSGSDSSGSGPDESAPEGSGSEPDSPPSSGTSGSAPGEEAADGSDGSRADGPRASGSGAGEGRSAASAAAEPRVEGPAASIVEHMRDNYSGVGVKTARKLVEEFGEQTLEVIDRDPERVERVLPQHRAEAVLQARAAERERGGGAPDPRG